MLSPVKSNASNFTDDESRRSESPRMLHFSDVDESSPILNKNLESTTSQPDLEGSSRRNIRLMPAAQSFVSSNAVKFGISPQVFDKYDIHVHVPEGATPKDGPSAGVGMVTSIVSAITEIPVNKNIAMTGEITLRGVVLPIGGLKEKLLAAHRAGIKKVLIPFENKKDLVEIPEVIKNNIEIVCVKSVDEVLKHALTKELKRVEWVEVEQVSKTTGQSATGSTH